MTGSLGSIRGQIRIDAKQALAEYAAVRAANASTRTSLLASSAVFAKVGVGALAAAAPIVLLFSKAISAAADFEKKIDFFGAVTGATQDEMDAVAKKAVEMSKTTVFSAAQMADAFVEFGKAGISTQDILNGVADATANLAQAADINIGDASQIIVSTMKTFNLGAGQAAHIADVLAGAANASIIEVQDVATSLKYAGGIAAATKIPFESVVDAIALLGQAGIKGSTAGTSLRQIMVSLTSQTPKATKVLKDLGIITKNNTNLFIDQQGHLKPLDQIFQILQDHTNKLTDAQRLAATKTIFNSRALASANILLKDGAKGFAAMNAEVSKTSALDVAHKRLDNLSGDVTHLKNSIQTMLIQAGGPLQGFMRGIVQALTKAVQWFGNLSTGQQKAILATLGAVAAFLILLGTLSLMIAVVVKTVKVYRDLKLAMQLLGNTKLIKNIVMGFRAIGAAMVANPMVLIVVAIIALVAAIIYCWIHFKKFRDIVKGVFNWLKKAGIDVWHALETAFHAVQHAVEDVGNFFKAAGKKLYQWLIQPYVDAVRGIIKAFNAIKKAISKAIDATLAFVKEHWTAIIALLLGPVGLTIDAIHHHWEDISRFTKFVFTAIGNFLLSIWNAIYKGVSAVVTVMINVLKAQWNVLVIATKAVWNALLAATQAVWAAIKFAIINPAVAIYNFLADIFTKAYNFVAGIFTKMYNTIAGIFSKIYGTVSDWMGRVYNFIAGIAGRVFNVGVDIVNKLWNGLTSKFAWLIAQIYGFVQKIGDPIAAIVQRAFSIGAHLVDGIWQGIMSLKDWLWNKVKDWMNDLWNGIKNFFGIHSPSRKMAWAGEQMVRGLASGITDNQKLATQAVAQMNKAVMKQMDTSGLNVNPGLQGLMGNVSASRAAMMNQSVAKGAASGPAIVIEQLHNHEAIPETLSLTLPRMIRKINYTAPGPAR